MTDGAGTLRLDKLLWYLRFCKSRSTAQSLCEAGHIRIDGRRVERGHAPVRAGCTVTLPLAGGVRVVRITALPVRRGPATEAQSCYLDLDGQSAALGRPSNESDSQQSAPP